GTPASVRSGLRGATTHRTTREPTAPDVTTPVHLPTRATWRMRVARATQITRAPRATLAVQITRPVLPIQAPGLEPGAVAIWERPRQDVDSGSDSGSEWRCSSPGVVSPGLQ